MLRTKIESQVWQGDDEIKGFDEAWGYESLKLYNGAFRKKND